MVWASYAIRVGDDPVFMNLTESLPTEMRRLKELEDENARLKKLVAELERIQ